MAGVDVYGEISPGSELILDITNQKFAPLVMDLLPRGPAWDREGPVLQALVRAEALELSRVAVRAKALERELDPNQTFECVTDWEESYGLPECATPDTIEGRRAAIKAKLLAQTGHDHSLGWWTDLVAKLGYYLHFVDVGPTFMTCIDDCVDLLTDEAFAFTLAVDHGPDDALLECFVAKNALLISFPIVHYLWQSVTAPNSPHFTGVACNSKGYTAATATDGDIYVTDDLMLFQVVTAGVDSIAAVCAVDGVFLACGYVGLGGILRSDDNGASWVPSGVIPCDLLGITRGPYADEIAIAVGEDGRIFGSEDAGLSWGELLSPVGSYLYAVTCAKDLLVAVGNSGIGGVVRSVTGGATWELVVVPGMIQDLWAVAGHLDTVIAVGASGEIWRSTDKALTWELIFSGVGLPLYGVTGSPSGRWTACGRSGIILQSLDDGLTWEIQVSPVTDDLRAAGFHLPDGRAVLVGTNKAYVVE